MDLSIIIVNYNKALILDRCLSSIYQNTKNLTFEVILIDNGSKDNSVELVKTKYKNIALIENKINSGFAAASNQGLKICKGRYALLLNNDTEIRNAALNKMVEFMDTGGDIGGLGPKLLNQDLTVQREGSVLGKRFWNSNIPIEAGFITGAALMVRRDVLDKIGLLDENFFFYNEDLDLCRRIKKAGFKLYFLPSAEIIHIGQKAKNIEMIYEGYRGGIYFCGKHYNKLINILYRFGVLTDISLRIAYLSIISIFYNAKETKNEIAQYNRVIGILGKKAKNMNLKNN